MKRALTLCLLFAVGAQADPPRKTKPEKLLEEASKAFDAAVALEDAGKTWDALREYGRSFEMVPHPNTIFNIANLEARVFMYTRAIAAYERYLTLEPHAKDRKTVEATIDALINTPVTLPLTAPAPRDARTNRAAPLDTSDAYVISDGKIVRRPNADAPTSIVLAHGFHSLDFVRAITFYAYNIDVRGLNKFDKTRLPSGAAKQDGNVVFRVTDAGRHLRVRFQGERIDGAALLTVPPGTYRIVVSDRRYECPPVTIVVPKDTNQTLYVHLAPAELPKLPMADTDPKRCRKLDVSQLPLAF